MTEIPLSVSQQRETHLTTMRRTGRAAAATGCALSGGATSVIGTTKYIDFAIKNFHTPGLGIDILNFINVWGLVIGPTAMGLAIATLILLGHSEEG